MGADAVMLKQQVTGVPALSPGVRQTVKVGAGETARKDRSE